MCPRNRWLWGVGCLAPERSGSLIGMDTTAQLLQAFRAHNWYAVAALLLFCLISFWKNVPLARVLYQKIPDGWRWLPPVAVAGATGFFTAFFEGADYKQALLQLVVAVVAIALPAMGLQGGLQELRKRGAGLASEDPLHVKVRPSDQGSGPPIPPAAALLLIGLGLSQVCCTGSLQQAQASGVKARQVRLLAPGSAERCQTLDDRRITWGAVGKGAAVLAGASGISTLPVDDERADIGLAAGALTMAAVAAVAVVVEEGAGEAWARECSSP